MTRAFQLIALAIFLSLVKLGSVQAQGTNFGEIANLFNSACDELKIAPNSDLCPSIDKSIAQKTVNVLLGGARNNFTSEFFASEVLRRTAGDIDKRYYHLINAVYAAQTPSEEIQAKSALATLLIYVVEIKNGLQNSELIKNIDIKTAITRTSDLLQQAYNLCIENSESSELPLIIHEQSRIAAINKDFKTAIHLMNKAIALGLKMDGDRTERLYHFTKMFDPSSSELSILKDQADRLFAEEKRGIVEMRKITPAKSKSLKALIALLK